MLNWKTHIEIGKKMNKYLQYDEEKIKHVIIRKYASRY